jgi:5-methylcytosine-specific restriction protein A
MSRREFTKRIKLERWQHAKGKCEGCGIPCSAATGFHYDHDLADALGGEPTFENCRLLCTNCHGAKTGQRDIPAIAKSNRTRNRHLGIARKPTKFRGWRKMDGTVVYANDRRK